MGDKVITETLQANGNWSLQLRDVPDKRLGDILPYGIIYATYGHDANLGNSLEEVKKAAFWAGWNNKIVTGTNQPSLMGTSLSWLIGSSSETGATSGTTTQNFYNWWLADTDTDEAENNENVEDELNPKDLIASIWDIADLPEDFPLFLGKQNWEDDTALRNVELPGWSTLMQALNTICGLAVPPGAWFVRPSGEIVVGTGNRIFATPPDARVISTMPNITNLHWSTGFQAESINVTIDASRSIGAILVVGDNAAAMATVDSDDYWTVGNMTSKRVAVANVQGDVTPDMAELFAQRILQSRAKEQVVINAQFSARSKVATSIMPGDVIGVIEPLATWPTNPTPEAWITYTAGHAESPYPAVVTQMQMPFTRGMGVFYNLPGRDTVYDLTNYVQWESDKIKIQAGDAVNTIYETVLNTGSFVNNPTAIPEGSGWEWR